VALLQGCAQNLPAFVSPDARFSAISAGPPRPCPNLQYSCPAGRRGVGVGRGATRVAIYARVSTGEQTPELQLCELRDYADRRGFAMHREYVDRASGDVRRRRRAPTPSGNTLRSGTDAVRLTRVFRRMWPCPRFRAAQARTRIERGVSNRGKHQKHHGGPRSLDHWRYPAR
jgi:hypothetical protein